MLEEIIAVISYSTRTQVAFFLGLLFFIVTLLVGAHLIGNISFEGALAPLADGIREILNERYEKVAFGGLGGFWLLAFRFYKKDRKKLLGT